MAPNQSEVHQEVSRESRIVVSTLYGTGWLPVDSDGHALPSRWLDLGYLEPYYDDAQELLPKIADRVELDLSSVRFGKWEPRDRLLWVRVWLFRMPSGQTTAALGIGVRVPLGESELADPAGYEELLGELVDLLDDCRSLDVEVGSEPLRRYLGLRGVSTGAHDAAELGVSRERHQLVVGPSLPAGITPTSRHIVDLLYPWPGVTEDGERMSFDVPRELNQLQAATVALGPYVSLLFGTTVEQDNAAFLSASQLVAAAARLRYVRETVHRNLRWYRDAQHSKAGVAQISDERKHEVLGQVADQLGDLELELSFSVQATADISLLVPSVRVALYHEALFVRMGLRRKFEVVSQMLRRLDHSIQAELTSLEATESRADDDRRRRWEATAVYLGTLPLACALALGFLGMNAAELFTDTGEMRSMWSPVYWPAYGVMLAVVAGGFLIPVVMAWSQRRFRAARRSDVDAVTLGRRERESDFPVRR